MVKSYQTGLTLIELIVTLAIAGLLFFFVVSSFGGVMKSFQVRNAGEALLNGVQLARGEAISRNQNAEFILGANTAWKVRLAGSAVDLHSRESAEGSTDVVRVTDPIAATTITFNPLGGVIANADASGTLTQIDVIAQGTSRTLRLNIGAGGRPKLCNPNKADGPTAC